MTHPHLSDWKKSRAAKHTSMGVKQGEHPYDKADRIADTVSPKGDQPSYEKVVPGESPEYFEPKPVVGRI